MFIFGRYGLQTTDNEQSFNERVTLLKDKFTQAEAVVIGAGAGLSTAAGYTYSGERLQTYFADFVVKYSIRDMYSGGFYPYDSLEEFWGFWCRYIWINRYAPIPTDLYVQLFELVKHKDYFVLTTNVDHCFQRSGFDKQRLFYTQGDYGLFQSSTPQGASAHRTYDNYETIKRMVCSEGFTIAENGELLLPKSGQPAMTVPSELVPVCPDDGQPMTTNLRADGTFVEDEGWHKAQIRYHDFLQQHAHQRVLYLELGVGMNTPVIIKFPFWKYTEENPNAWFASLNLGEAGCSQAIAERSVCFDEGIAPVVEALRA